MTARHMSAAQRCRPHGLRPSGVVVSSRGQIVRTEAEFRLLGPFEVRVDEESIALRGGRERALLALLVVNANRAVARGRLIDELWDQQPPGEALKAIHVYVSRLRKFLPEGMIVTRGHAYTLVVNPERVDLLRFERLVETASKLPPDEASSTLSVALALWQGPPLVELDDSAFVRVERQRLESLRVTALEAKIDAEMALGRHLAIMGELEALVAEQPYRERLRAALMLALYRSGRQADALATFRDARAALAELGLEPSAALRTLERQILSQDPILEPWISDRQDVVVPTVSARAQAVIAH